MFATRRVLASAASAASTTQSGALLKPRTQLETITAAFKTLHGFIFDDKTRHSFVDAVNKGVINPYILGQADMGFFVTLALHHNLNSVSGLFYSCVCIYMFSTFIKKTLDAYIYIHLRHCTYDKKEPLSKYKNQFQAEEFLEGSEAALESFQETLYSLDKKVLKDVQEEWIKIQKLEERVDTNDTQSSMVEKGANDKETDHQKDHMDEIFKKANMSLEKIELLEQAISAHGDWKAMAEEDPDSLYGQFYNMVSDPLLEACKNQFMQSVKHCFLLKIPRMDYELESGKIQDVSFQVECFTMFF